MGDAAGGPPQGGQVNPFGANTAGGQNYARQMAGNQPPITMPGNSPLATLMNFSQQPQAQKFSYFEGARPANAWRPPGQPQPAQTQQWSSQGPQGGQMGGTPK